jgi:hypothetical protein
MTIQSITSTDCIGTDIIRFTDGRCASCYTELSALLQPGDKVRVRFDRAGWVKRIRKTK